jgi:hypothetical protein
MKKLTSNLWRLCGAAVCATLIVGLVVRTACAMKGQVLVAVLEEVPGVYAGEGPHYGVRVMFRHDAHGWQLFPNQCSTRGCLASITSEYPARNRWIISSGGRRLGIVTAHTPADFQWYAQIGIQNVDSGQLIPKLGSASRDYSGFLDTPVRRPLLATSGVREIDVSRNSWTPKATDPADLNLVWPEFKRLVPLIDDCRVESHGEYISEKGRAPGRDEFEIARTWSNKAGDEIIDARVRESAFKGCDGPLIYPSEYWLYREKSQEVWPLPGQEPSKRARLLMPIDFVDLDGHDSALFLMAGYNAGGYAFFYDGFRHVTNFTWSYH